MLTIGCLFIVQPFRKKFVKSLSTTLKVRAGCPNLGHTTLCNASLGGAREAGYKPRPGEHDRGPDQTTTEGHTAVKGKDV